MNLLDSVFLGITMTLEKWILLGFLGLIVIVLITLIIVKISGCKKGEKPIKKVKEPSAKPTDKKQAGAPVVVINNSVPQQQKVATSEKAKAVEPQETVIVVDEIKPESEKIIEEKIVEIDDGVKIVDKDDVAFKSNAGLTLAEVYELLSKEQKGFFDGLISYAMSKEKATEKRTDRYVQIKSGTKPLIKLSIRKETTTAAFKIEDEMLKDYRRSHKGEMGAIKVKDTVVSITDVNQYETAKGLIDVSFDSIQQEIARERAERNEKRRLRRQELKAAAE